MSNWIREFDPQNINYQDIKVPKFMQKSDDGDKNSNKLSIPVSKEWLN